MTDKELLELAAKAAGTEIVPYTWDKGAPWGEHEGFVVAYQGPDEWNPLHNDGDALRLAVKLGLLVDCDDVLQEVEAVLVMRGHDDDYVRMSEKYGTDQYAATRRAIVRAAAIIGQSPQGNL